MPLPDDRFDEMLARVMSALPPSTFTVTRGSTTESVEGYLRERASKSESGMGEVGRSATFYITSGSLQTGDLLDGADEDYVAYDTAPSHGFASAWRLIRIPPFSAMQTYSLDFEAQGTTWSTDPDTGNRVPSRSTQTVEAVLKASRDPKLADVLGVRPGEVVLEGYCVNPTTLPSGVSEGSEATLTIGGVAGTFVLGPRVPDPMTAKQVAFGEYLVGRWSWQS